MPKSPDDSRVRIEYVALTKLLPALRNPREHDLGAIHESIKRFGYNAPILIDEHSGRMVAGHGRVKALMQRKLDGQPAPDRIEARDGDWFVPVIRGVEFKNAREAEAYLVADNRVTELATWDEPGLADMLRDIAQSEEGLAGTGYDGDDLDKLLNSVGGRTYSDPEPGKPEELQKKWKTALGQTWDIAGNRIFCGDSRQVPAAFFRGNKIRLIWTDPPYGVSYSEKTAHLQANAKGRARTAIENDSLSAEDTEALFVGALAAAVPHCETGAAIYATVPSGPLYPRFVHGLEAGGFTYKHGLVWVKQQFVMGRSDYHYRHEPILYGWLENGAHFWNGSRSQDSVFEVDKPHVSDLHPTTKPVELIAKMIANSSQPADIVYDPFAGSGSTLLAAHQLNRIGYGVELSPGYVAVVLERLADLGLKPSLEGEAEKPERAPRRAPAAA